MSEESLVLLVGQIAHEGLRRHVARALWFDCIDQVHEGEKLEQLKTIADPERLDEMFDFTEDEFCQALQVVGYESFQIEQRLKIHQAHRRQYTQGRALPEIERVKSEARNYWSHYESLRFFDGKR